MIDLVNLQRKVKIETAVFKAFVADLHKGVDEVGESPFSVAFVSDRRMTELNEFFRGKDSTTDVLSFPHESDPADVPVSAGGFPENFLGDIVISVEQAQRQAKENKLTLENEIKQLILHGVLHLCGYDHETDDGEMNERELELRTNLGI
jgi:probable rRNA maturation factor